MAIKWVTNAKTYIGSEADVVITEHKQNNYKAIRFAFKTSVVRMKFGDAKKLAFGYDNETNRLYIVPGDGAASYTVTKGKTQDTRQYSTISEKRFEGIVQTSALLGNFNLEFDPTERAYYIDYADVIRFQSKKIKTI